MTPKNEIEKRNPHSPVRGVDVPAKLAIGIGKIRLDKKGHELHDPVPIQPPLGYRHTPSLAEQIRTMVRGEALKRAAQAAGAESFEEADDFEVGDDYDPRSPYEEIYDPPTPLVSEDTRIERAVGRALGNVYPKDKAHAESLEKEGYVKVNEYYRKLPVRKDDPNDTPPTE